MGIMRRVSQVSLIKMSLKYRVRQFSAPSSFVLKPSSTISTGFVSGSMSTPKLEIFDQPITKFHSLTHTISSGPSTHLKNHENLRKFSDEAAPSFDSSKEIDEINLKFAEAREEIEMALESKETVYFDEEAESAREAVKVVLDMFEGLLAKLPENERASVQRFMGLKIEQLKAELEQLND
ncbi:embryogenesis-like protein [Macadamia integrifolia]|uniref:embryogenesis-like protein n=1 Tax=Macadamia integrifolia TaxID=60698 RepID=UPI001C4FE6CF|nr:embryogenesis-like protein [Macadamia integrifolia]XP_042493539.1 embryogenesis-like protein [Macadamia integrifolia]